MGEHDFQGEVLQRLARIEERQDLMYDQCKPCQRKIDDVERVARDALQSAKSAHFRLNDMQTDRNELKHDLTAAIKEQIGGIYRTAGIVGGVVSLAVAILAAVIKW